MHEVLFRKLERLKEEVLYLEKNRTLFLKNINISVETKKITERSVYLCAEMVLDIADLVITVRGLPKPSTYSDTIYKLGDHKIIPISFSRKFVYIAGLRNFLAHEALAKVLKPTNLSFRVKREIFYTQWVTRFLTFVRNDNPRLLQEPLMII